MPLDPKARSAAHNAFAASLGDLDAAITAYLAAISETRDFVPRASTEEIVAKVFYWDDPSPDDLWPRIVKAEGQADGQ